MLLSKEKGNLFYDTHTQLKDTYRVRGNFMNFGLASEL